MKELLNRLVVGVICVLLVFSTMPLHTHAAAYDTEQGYKALDVRFWEDEKPALGFYINSASRYILEMVEEPKIGSISGDWAVMGLLRGHYTGYDYMNYIPKDYFERYVTALHQYVEEKNGVLDKNKSTEWSRLMLTMTALGEDVRDVAGYDFINELSKSYAFSHRQGINGPIWEIIALNTAGYSLDAQPKDQKPGDETNTVGLMIDYILSREVQSSTGEIGGWTLSGNEPDADVTGMALQALAPYYLNEKRYVEAGASASYSNFAQVVERGIVALVNMQQKNGGFGSWGANNTESIVQVIVALTALQLDPLAPSITLPHINKTVDFITAGAVLDGVWSNNPIDALLTFWAAGSGSSSEIGGFKHVTTGFDGGGGAGTAVNGMATEQALYGLIAYDRFLQKQNALYDMTDMKNGEYRQMQASTLQVTFDGNSIVKTSTQSKSPYAVIELPVQNDVYSWNTKANGTGTKYMPGDKLVVPQFNITLYAQKQQTSNTTDTKNVQAVIDLIASLPTAEQVTINHASAVLVAVTAYGKLTAAEQQLVTNYSELALIESKLQQLLAVSEDDAEKPVNDESKTPVLTMEQAAIKGKEMTLSFHKASASFDAIIDIEVISQIMRQQITKVHVVDEHNVTITLDAQELLNNFNKNSIQQFQLTISSYDAKTSTFNVKLVGIDHNGEAHRIQMEQQYIFITIPYSYFENGTRLHEYNVMKLDGQKHVAVPHMTDAQQLLLKVKSDGTYVFTNKAVQFKDIGNSSMKEDIVLLAKRGVVDGSLQSFNPKNEVTRAQFALMLTRALGLEAKAQTAVFEDVRGKEYEQAVQALYEAGITGGSNGKFNPADKLTRQQAALMMARVLRYTGFNTDSVSTTINFKDGHKISKDALQDIGMLNTLTIMTGNTAGEFMPKNPLTRAQMAKILKGTLKVAQMM